MDFLRAQLIQQQGGNFDQAQLNALVEAYTNMQPNDPLLQQYIDYMIGLATGDLGRSVWYGEPVSEILASALPWTVFIMSIGLLLTFTLGVVLGAIMAYVEGSKFDVIATLVSIFLSSIPYYVAAIMFLMIFSLWNQWFPTGGRMNPNTTPGINLPFIIGVFYHAALPIASIVVTGLGMQALSMRGNSVRILGEDYLRVAHLRGLSSNRIALRYVGRNAILPMYTGLMISIGFMFGGSVILEEIFGYPGIGYYMLQAISARDYLMMMGAFLLITIAVVLGIYIADLTYGKIDPRAGEGANRESY
ncbi:ABC transporter permease [Halobacterium noricense]|uniref:ABC transporter permease n=2 Tax=Haladaptatus pallidirubidus TaxID=1008152 RepID=A0AAV3UPH1_9EURY